MKSGEREYKYDVPEYLRALLMLAWETQEAMFDAIEARRETSNPREEREFKRLLQKLYFRYKPKFEHTEKVEVGDLQEDIEEVGILQLSFEDARTLTRKIRDLMEILGHTRFERNIYQEEGFGVNSKDEAD